MAQRENLAAALAALLALALAAPASAQLPSKEVKDAQINALCLQVCLPLHPPLRRARAPRPPTPAHRDAR